MLINRQPVFDGKTNLQGYEAQTCGKAVSDRSRREVLSTIAENLGELAGNHWAMVTLPSEEIESGAHEPLSPERALIHLSGKPTDSSFIQSLGKLSRQGYRVAVAAPECESSVTDSAQIVRMDLSDCGTETVAERVRRFRGGKSRVMVSGVDTHSDFELCKAAGVDLFEGRFFYQAKPGRDDLPLTRVPTMRLLTALQNPDVRLQDLEGLVRNNLPLTFKLLTFANSTYVGLSRPVESIKHAVGLVGLERIRKWASLLLYSTIEEKPRELFIMAAVRARMCEQLADSDDEWRQSVFFTVGLLSVLDAVLDRPMAAVAELLPLSPEVRSGLVDGDGILGSTLKAVMDYEMGVFDSVYLQPYHPSLVRNAYFEALHWTRTVSTGLSI